MIFWGARNTAYLESTHIAILTFTNEEEPCQHCCKAIAKIVESHLIKKILLEYAFSMCMKGSFANSPKKYMF